MVLFVAKKMWCCFFSHFPPRILLLLNKQYKKLKSVRIFKVFSQELDLQHEDLKGCFTVGFEKD